MLSCGEGFLSTDTLLILSSNIILEYNIKKVISFLQQTGTLNSLLPIETCLLGADALLLIRKLLVLRHEDMCFAAISTLILRDCTLIQKCDTYFRLLWEVLDLQKLCFGEQNPSTHLGYLHGQLLIDAF